MGCRATRTSPTGTHTTGVRTPRPPSRPPSACCTFLLGLSDRQAAETVRCRIDCKYAMAMALDDRVGGTRAARALGHAAHLLWFPVQVDRGGGQAGRGEQPDLFTAPGTAAVDGQAVPAQIVRRATVGGGARFLPQGRRTDRRRRACGGCGAGAPAAVWSAASGRCAARAHALGAGLALRRWMRQAPKRARPEDLARYQ